MVQVYKRLLPLHKDVTAIRLDVRRDEAIIPPSSFMNSRVQKTMSPSSQTWGVRAKNQY
jgi:hypothetical protein